MNLRSAVTYFRIRHWTTPRVTAGFVTSKMAAVAVVENSPGQDAIAEGLLDLLKPAIQQVDLHVHSVR